ncbi:Carotenoid oxygenase [Corchorus olitorius]|uniref:Carotenoid oxygenase n=1 Tax=Corchorus olitorius TaxID=93759 RepID=A0A1R3HAZ5_9ROSI|nr:Carotenoid oxygenase [Corchorus olitorius]
MSPPLSFSAFFSTLASLPHLLHDILDPPLHPWADPTHVYAGNMAPVGEMEPIDCPIIEGKLPVSLKGVYIRNASAPKILTGHFNLMNGFGVANTGLAFFASKLFALCDSDLPYEINLTKVGDIETLGRWEFEKKFMSNMNAHPKVDLDTKETFAFSWSLTFPYLTLLRFDENGVKQNEVPISSIKQPCFIHDFAITKRFAVFHETQLVYSLGKVVTGSGSLVEYEPNKVPRIGILPKYAMDDSELKWFPVPGFNTIHVLNAWESEDDENEIVFVAPNILSVDNIFNLKIYASLGKVKINIKTGDVSREKISPRNLEFGSINPSHVGRQTRARGCEKSLWA